MLNLNPKYLYNDEGIKEYVLIPFEEYKKILEELEDKKDLEILDKAIEENKGKEGTPIEDLMKDYGLNPEEIRKNNYEV